jgi:hypothetical protein
VQTIWQVSPVGGLTGAPTGTSTPQRPRGRKPHGERCASPRCCSARARGRRSSPRSSRCGCPPELRDGLGIWRAKPKKVWTDQEGNTYLQFFNSYAEPLTASGAAASTARVLMRIDKRGEILEFTGDFGSEDGTYPEKIDPNAKIERFSIYFIYHRTQ